MQLFHGTALISAGRLLAGEPLTAARAASEKIDGDPGFYLATRASDAEFFAYRRAPGAVIVVEIEEDGVQALIDAGGELRPIPMTRRSPYFAGSEFWIPPNAFALFNDLRAAGELSVHT